MKKILPLAVASALVAVNSAQAVHVNPDGEGSVLLYPYYSVEGGQDTYISVVNTTNETKAVKVRVLEGMNSQEVLDFNIYMSPQDHWSAVITSNEDGGASIATADTTCTLPQSLASTAPGTSGPTVPFRDFLYSSDSVNGVERTREGYIEVIEMGVVTDASIAIAVKHTSAGVPVNCDLPTSYFQGGGQWSNDANDGIAPGTGGLYGYGVLINVNNGTDVTYDATALANFNSLVPLHTNPGNTLPTLGDAEPAVDVLLDDGTTVVSETFPAGLGILATGAALMRGSIQNDYVLEPTIAAETDWVVTFPTKRPHVNVATGGTVIPPFTELWDPKTSEACEEISVTYYDREEASESPDPLDFSPAPSPGKVELCKEANVVSFNGSEVLSGSDRVRGDLTLDTGFDNGWMTIDFTSTTGRTITGDGGTVFAGLPVIGFAAQQYSNNTLEVDGATVLSNYAGAVAHKATKVIS